MIRQKKINHKPVQKNTVPAPPQQPSSFPMRLNQYLAHGGLCARRKADEYIAAGHVCLNGQKETRMGIQVQAQDVVSFKGRKINLQPYRYLLFNKPKDCLSTRHDPQGRPTIFSWLKGAAEGLSSAGRLDRNSTGLLLLTNDGALLQRLSHPSQGFSKIYALRLNKALSAADLARIQNEGIRLEDGPIRPDEISISTADPTQVGVKLHSGRNRVLRRMFAALGYKVLALDRTAYGPLTQKRLPRGQWRLLRPYELSALWNFS